MCKKTYASQLGSRQVFRNFSEPGKIFAFFVSFFFSIFSFFEMCSPAERAPSAPNRSEPAPNTGVECNFKPEFKPCFESGFESSFKPGFKRGFKRGFESGFKLGFKPGDDDDR